MAMVGTSSVRSWAAASTWHEQMDFRHRQNLRVQGLQDGLLPGQPIRAERLASNFVTTSWRRALVIATGRFSSATADGIEKGWRGGQQMGLRSRGPAGLLPSKGCS